MTRIFVPVHWLTDFGGLHENVFDTVAALTGQGWDCTVMAPAAAFNARLRNIGVTVLEHDMRDVADAIRIAAAAGPYRLVHAHPFLARQIGEGVADLFDIPVTLTVHGQYTDKITDRISAVICVSERISEYIRENFPTMSERVQTIVNAVDDRVLKPHTSGDVADRPYTVIVCSRIDPDKKVLMQTVLDVAAILSRAHHPVELRMQGDSFYGNVDDFRSTLQTSASGRLALCWMGWTDDRVALAEQYNCGDLIVGSGRAAMEAVACLRPTIAVASRGYVGLLNEDTLPLGIATNFGGVLEEGTVYDRARLEQDLANAADLPVGSRWRLRETLLQSHSAKRVSQHIVKLTRQLLSG